MLLSIGEVVDTFVGGTGNCQHTGMQRGVVDSLGECLLNLGVAVFDVAFQQIGFCHHHIGIIVLLIGLDVVLSQLDSLVGVAVGFVDVKERAVDQILFGAVADEGFEVFEDGFFVVGVHSSLASKKVRLVGILALTTFVEHADGLFAKRHALVPILLVEDSDGHLVVLVAEEAEDGVVTFGVFLLGVKFLAAECGILALDEPVGVEILVFGAGLVHLAADGAVDEAGIVPRLGVVLGLLVFACGVDKFLGLVEVAAVLGFTGTGDIQ